MDIVNMVLNFFSKIGKLFKKQPKETIPISVSRVVQNLREGMITFSPTEGWIATNKGGDTILPLEFDDTQKFITSVACILAKFAIRECDANLEEGTQIEDIIDRVEKTLLESGI